MPKAKPTQVITHRIEMGQWERDNIGKPIATTVSNAKVITSVAMVGGAGALGLAAYGLYWFFESVWSISDKAEEWWDEIKQGPISVPDNLTEEEIEESEKLKEQDELVIVTFFKKILGF